MPRGFTLIEILISIAIIALLGVVAIPNLKTFNEGQNLNNAASDLGSMLHTAQINAQTGAKCKNGYTSVEDSNDNIPGGTWKVTVSSTGFTLQASKCQNLTASPLPFPIGDPFAEIHPYAQYSSGISLYSITNCSLSNQIIFTQNNTSLSTTCSVVLQDTIINGNKYKTICIDKGGAITIKDGNVSC